MVAKKSTRVMAVQKQKSHVVESCRALSAAPATEYALTNVSTKVRK